MDSVINYGGLFDSVNHKELLVFETIVYFLYSLVLTTDSGKTIYLCLISNPKVAQDSILIAITLEIKAPKESQAFLPELCSILFLGPP